MTPNKDFDEILYILLTKTCQKMAKEMAQDVDAIIKDEVLKEIATFIPTSLDYLTQVLGLNLDLATHLFTVIQKYVADNHISTSLDVPIKAKTYKAIDKVYIVQQIDRKIDLAVIADAKLMSIEELLDDIESIYAAGIKLNLTYYVNSILTPEEQQEIQSFLIQSSDNKLQKAYEALGDSYPKQDIRIMYIKMLFDTLKKG
jgi:ATP-dependent DNA helicase RecQ